MSWNRLTRSTTQTKVLIEEAEKGPHRWVFFFFRVRHRSTVHNTLYHDDGTLGAAIKSKSQLCCGIAMKLEVSGREYLKSVVGDKANFIKGKGRGNRSIQS